MYIRHLTLKNVKLLRNVSMSFMRGDEPRMWTVLVGENGLCKTTLLQTIALAAVGSAASNKLTEAQTYADRRKPRRAAINAEFGFGNLHHRNEERSYPFLRERLDEPPHVLSTIGTFPNFDFFFGESSYGHAIGKGKQTTTGEDPITEARGKRLPYWLVAGYGTTRSLPVPKSIEKPVNAVVERLLSLFQPSQIVGTGFADLFAGKTVNAYALKLKHALLDQDQVLPRVKGLEVRGKAGVRSASHLVESQRFTFDTGKDSIKIPATWLSQGYQAMISWIADIVGQFFWDAGGVVELENMEGLVLIDEIDIHLHPTWQLGLIKALKATFPKVQFVATTHTAMVLPGLEADEVYRTKLDDEGNVVVEPVGQSPNLMTGSEILSTFFGIDKLYPADVGAALQRFGYLAGKPDRTDAEEKTLQDDLALLRKEGVKPGWQPTPRSSRVTGGVKKRSRRKRET